MSGPGAFPGASEPEPGTLRAMAEAAEAIAREAGALVAARFRSRPAEMQKGHAHNLVTEVDLASEALIVAALARAFPAHAVRAEEGGGSPGEPAEGGSGDAAGGGFTWVVDPLDGTNNYAHGLPVFCVSLAAMRGDTVWAGVSFDPLRDELFRATRGGGAWLNGEALAVSRRPSLDQSIVATGFPYDKSTNPDNNLIEFSTIVPHVRGVRRMGSAALDLAYVAAGRLDAYWEHGTNAWDVAAGVLLVEEAGGRVSDYAGRPARVEGGRFLASNGLVHAPLLALLAEARRGRAGG